VSAVLALVIGAAMIMAWEVRRGWVDGQMRFQVGFVEREKSSIFFWSWFAIGVAITLAAIAFSIVGLLAMVRGTA